MSHYGGSVAADGRLSAGEFSQWLSEMTAAIAGEYDSDVACGDCVGCCQSFQFVHIGPEEADALRHIPSKLLFPAPMRPKGHVLMGYDERGWCPMLSKDGCTIYEHRPVTCRTFDCRVFPAAGVSADEDKPLVQAAASRWDFIHGSVEAEQTHTAVMAAAAAVVEARGSLPDDLTPHTQTHLAVLATEIYPAFMGGDADDINLVELIRGRSSR